MAGYNARSACKGHGKHITDELGQAQLRSVFVPHGWVVNKVEHDYGIDFEIEIFEQHKSTGASFKVQLRVRSRARIRLRKISCLRRSTYRTLSTSAMKCVHPWR